MSNFEGLHRIEILGEEYIRRRDVGETLSIDDFVKEHSEHASQLRDYLEALDVIEQIKPVAKEKYAGFPTISDYRIIREIGRGGMGVVYEAEQVSLSRRVALKTMRVGVQELDTNRQRFQHEASAAAKLHHSNIVPVYDVGEQDGTSYYAMQYIDGRGLDHVVNEARVLLERREKNVVVHSAEQRLALSMVSSPTTIGVGAATLANDVGSEDNRDSNPDADSISPTKHAPDENQVQWQQPISSSSKKTLANALADQSTSVSNSSFRHYCKAVARVGYQVADALHCAHSNGVVHRDIKPANLLMDVKGDIWVADFGLVKTENLELTQTGALVGTLRYMSPERFHGVCDSRSDVYSLGLTLYEMLALRPAFESTGRLSLLEEIRSTDPKQLREINPRIPFDLQTIVVKAIEKDPKRRYQDASAMAEDLARFIDGRPILARRVSTFERTTIWSKRNPVIAGLLAILLAGVLATVAGLTYATITFRDLATANSDLAEEALESKTIAERSAAKADKSAVEAKQAAIEAERAATRKQNIVDSFVAAFEGFNVGTNEGVTHETTALEVLDRALEEMNSNSKIADDPLSKASLLFSIGRSLVSLGEVERGIKSLESAVAIRTEHLGREHDETGFAIAELSMAYGGGTVESREASALLDREALEINMRKFGPHHAETLRSRFHVANHDADVRAEEYRQVHEQILQDMRNHLGDEHRYTLFSMTDLGHLYGDSGQYDKAIEMLQLAYKTRVGMLGKNHSDTLLGLLSLATILEQAGRYDEATEALETCLEVTKTKFGDFHLRTFLAQKQFANLLRVKGQKLESIELYQRHLKDASERFDDNHALIGSLKDGLALSYLEAGQFYKALPLFEDVYAVSDNWKRGKDHVRTHNRLRGAMHLATCYGRCGRSEDELRLLMEIEEQVVETVPEDHPTHLAYIDLLGRAYWNQRRYEDAIEQRKKAIAIKQKTLGKDHPSLTGEMASLGAAYNMAGKPEEALPLLEDVYQRSVKQLGATHIRTTVSLHNVGFAYKLLKQYDRAIETFQQVLENAEKNKTLLQHYPLMKNFNSSLAMAYAATGQMELAVPQMKTAWDLVRKNLGPNHPATNNAADVYGDLYLGARKFSDGIAVLEKLLEAESELLPDHQLVQQLRYELADLYFAIGEFEKARQRYEINKNQFCQQRGKDHQSSVYLAANLSAALIQIGQYKKAQQELEDLIAILESSEKVNQKLLGYAKISLAEVFVRTEQHEEALELIDSTSELDFKPVEKARGRNLKGHLLGLQGNDKAESLLVSSTEKLEKLELSFRANWYLTAAMKRTISYFEKTEQTEESDSWRRRLAALENDGIPKNETPQNETPPNNEN